MKSGYLIYLNCLCVYTTIHIAVYMYIWPYANTAIRTDEPVSMRYTCGALLFLTSICFILSLVSTTHFPSPNGVVILNFYRAKVVTAGNTENTGPLLAENFS